MAPRDEPRRSYPRRVFVAVGVVAASAAVLYLLVVLSRVLLIVFAGVLMALFLGGLTDQLRRVTSLPRAPALAIVILGMTLILAGAVAVAGPSISGQINDLINRLPEAVNQLQRQLQQQAWAERLLGDSMSLRQLLPSSSDVLGGVTSAFSATLGVLANGFIILFIGIYGAAAPDPYVNGLVRLAPPDKRERMREALGAVRHALQWWLVGRITMMVVVGVLTAVGLWIAGVPSPLALGLIAALLAFIPYVGPILATVPAVLVALAVSLTKVLYVLIVYGAVQMLESYLITPLIQQRAVSLPPAVLITAQIAMVVLVGAIGVLLATPLAITIIVLLQMLYIEDVLGDHSVRVLGQS